MNDPLGFSAELLSWARRGGYALTTSDRPRTAILWSDPGGEVRYFLRQQEDGWYVLTRASRDGDEQFVLAGVSRDIVERHLFGIFGSILRDQLGLPFLRKPWNPSDLAASYSLSDISEDGHRVLLREGAGPIAIARERTTSLINLVPLSHFLQLNTLQLEEAYLSVDGFPLLEGDSYAPH